MQRWSTASCLIVLYLSTAAVAAPPRPAILFQRGPSHGHLDLQYATELHDQGFEIDYLDRREELTWDRLTRYDVLVLFDLPDDDKEKPATDTVDRFLRAGGGLLLFPTEHNTYRHPLYEVTRRYGARVPTERIKETNTSLVARFEHMPRTVAAYTDQVGESPVSEGVRGVWYPFAPSYNCSHTTPIVVDEDWTVVLRGSPSSISVSVNLSESMVPELEHSFERPEPVAAPAFFAVRTVDRGRLAFLNQWRVYTLGSGTKWLFDRQILSRGFGDRPSDMGRLLLNTFRWLAEPGLKSEELGGYTMPADRLVPPNRQAEVLENYVDRVWPYNRETIRSAAPPKHLHLYRGLIGARSAYSTGEGSVADYAAAARAVGLDYIVFAEDFGAMSADMLKMMQADCREHSREGLQLYAGITMVDNIGNRMLLLSPNGPWVPDYCLTGPDKNVFYRQAVDENGVYTGYGTPALNWALSSYHVHKGNIGYFHFSADPHANRIQHLRLYGMAGLQTFRGGKRLEDVSEDYLLCAAGTIPPVPVNVNLVTSPAELKREAAAARGLTWTQARSVDRVFIEGLYWTHQYASVNTFPSDGPQILLWPGCHRSGVLGAENFVTGRAVMPSPLAVRSEKGLKEARIYNGPDLYRRFLLGGTNEWSTVLVLSGDIQKNLVLVVEDIDGGRAVSYARRCWKDGGREVVFCSDHVNDCKSGGMLLAHGATGMLVNWPPPIHHSVAGYTWDGGPPAAMPLTHWPANQPMLHTPDGVIQGGRYNQTPICEFTDAGAVAVSSAKDEMFDPQMQRVVNPWHTFGPVGFEPELMTFVQRYREWLNPSVGVPPAGWAAPGVREGGNASLYRCEIEFVETGELTRIDIFGGGGTPPQATALMALKQGDTAPREIDLYALERSQTERLAPGDWLALYSRDVNSAQILINRGVPLSAAFHNPKHGSWIRFRAADPPKQVEPGQKLVAEVASLCFPVDEALHELADITRVMDYAAAPDGLTLERGTRLPDSPGLLDVRADRGAVVLAVPKPKNLPRMTLPVRVTGLNRRWSAGLYQFEGYCKGHYGSGKDRYRALGVDLEGCAYVPVYASWAERTRLAAGHPVTAGEGAEELFIQVTRVADDPATYHVSVNNPTDRAITTTLRATLPIAGFDGIPTDPITLAPGEYRVLQ